MLRICGFTPDYAELVSGVEVTLEGATAADLVEVSAKYGLPLVAVHASTSDLVRFEAPMIVHLQPPGELGHYVVVVRAYSDGSFATLECAEGKLERVSRGDFLAKWSGVVLVTEQTWSSFGLDRNLERVGALAIVITLLIWVTFAIKLWSGRKEVLKTRLSVDHSAGSS